MWICPKCSRENGNSFSSCKGCGYVISEKEKSYAIENTKQKIENYNSRHSSSGTTPGHTAYNGPKISYDNDDEYLENYYTDDMFDDDDYERKPKRKALRAVVTIIIILAVLVGGVFFLNYTGIINVFSSTDFKYTEDDTGITITGYTGKDTTVEIPDVINGNIVTAIGDKAFAESNLKTVTLPNTIKSIGERAFFSSKYLHIVSMQDGVKTIGSYAFASCEGFADVFLPESVETIGENILKDSGTAYIQGVPGSSAMKYAIDNDISFTPTSADATPLTVTPVRANDRQTYTTSNAGYGAGYIFSFMPYENSTYKITVTASIDGYLGINDFGIMGDIKSEEVENSKNHQTVLVANLKKEKKYYFGIENHGTEENKNIEFALEITPVTDKQTKAEDEAKKFVGQNYSFTAYTDLFYNQHSATGQSHYLEWNTNSQRIVDYYVEENGTIWVAINAPQGSGEQSYDEYGNPVESSSIWWHKLED